MPFQGVSVIDPVVSLVLQSWTFPPLVVIALAVSATLYIRGVRRLGEHGGFDRQVGRRRTLYAVLAYFVLGFAVFSPLAVFGGLLLSAHMVQHLILQQLAAPLFLLARPAPTILLGVPDAIRRPIAPLFAQNGALYRIGSFITQPLPSLMIFTVVLFGWHVQRLYDFAIGNPFVHDLQHFTTFAAALLFWWPAIDPLTGRNVSRRYWSILTQAITFLTTSLLGIYLAEVGVVVYASYRGFMGISALDDQVLGGMIMWVGGGIVYGATALATFAVANAASEAAQRRREALADAL